MLKAYKYRLSPNKSQEVLLNKHFGCTRFVYNWALSEKMKAYQKDKTNLSRYDLQARLPKMKKQEEAPAPAGPSSTDQLLIEIRDALKK